MSTHSVTGFHRPYFIVTWVEFSIAILLIVARCYTSLRIVKYVARDLPLAIATFVFGAASMVMLTIAAEEGLGGDDTVLLTSPHGSHAILFGWLNQFLAVIAIGFGKLTIAAFLQQIQGSYHTKFRTVLLWSLAATNFVLNCIAAVLMMVQCDPAQKLWNDAIPGSCAGRKRLQIFGYAQGDQLRGVIVWNQTEMWVVFIVSCLPPTKVFFARLIEQGFSGIPTLFKQTPRRGSDGDDI
ncbi:hypothetical protein BJX99DRAFT_262829 [Aspergillus californicus]